MTKHSKVNMKPEVKDLAEQIRLAENRPTVANVVENLVVREASRLKIGNRNISGSNIKSKSATVNVTTNKPKDIVS